MKITHWALIAMALGMGGALAQTQAQATKPAGQATIAWAAKPAKLAPYVAPNKLVWRLRDVLAAHNGKAGWTQTVFTSRDFQGDWVQMAPGETSKTRFYADDRVFWVVQSGQMRVSIEGQQPFVAGKHFLVQVPKRLQYSMETVGDAPVLFFRMTPYGETPSYPLGETPTPVKGMQWIRAAYSGHGDYDAINKPWIDFDKQIVQDGEKIPVWIRDDHTYVTIIRSQKGVPTPPDTVWGHFHANFPEIWLIPEGTQQFLVEGEKLITVQEGDLVNAPTGRWHRAMPVGDGPSTRLAYIPRPDNLHWYQPDQAGGN